MRRAIVLALVLGLVSAAEAGIFVTGAGPGMAPQVRVFDADTRVELCAFLAYDPAFRGGVRVAAVDVNGDGVPDVITGAGDGGGPHVRIWDGAALRSCQLVELVGSDRPASRRHARRVHGAGGTDVVHVGRRDGRHRGR